MKQSVKIFIGFAALLGLSSCLKEEPYFKASDSNAVIELDNTNSPSFNTYPFYFSDLGVVSNGGSATFNINLSYSGPGSAPEDITVNLALDEDGLAKYNDAEGTDYSIPSADVFQFPATAVIKKGTKGVQVKATVNVNDNYSFDASYALPIKIASVSSGTISGNFGEALYSFAVRNSYDGVYDFKGYITRGGDPVLSGNFHGYETDLSTSGAYSNTFAQIWSTGSGVAGIDGLTLTVDPATNKVTCWSTSNPALVNWDLYGDNGNRYDPQTRTYYVSFYWGTGPTNRSAIDTLTYLRPRD